MVHTEQSLREHRAIEDMLNAKVPVSEIKRNRYCDDKLPNLNGYYGMTAQRSAAQRRARRRKLVRFEDLRQHVIKQLETGWSPEQIAGRLQHDGQALRVSHETIYAYVYGPDGQSMVWRAISRIVARSGSQDGGAHRVALCFHRIGRSMNALTTSKPVRFLANGKAT